MKPIPFHGYETEFVWQHVDNTSKLWRFVKILTSSQNLYNMSKFWPLLQILTTCQTFDRLWTFGFFPNFWPLIQILTTCQIFYRLWKFGFFSKFCPLNLGRFIPMKESMSYLWSQFRFIGMKPHVFHTPQFWVSFGGRVGTHPFNRVCIYTYMITCSDNYTCIEWSKT